MQNTFIQEHDKRAAQRKNKGEPVCETGGEDNRSEELEPKQEEKTHRQS